MLSKLLTVGKYMRVACNPEAAIIWESIYYPILKAVSEIQAKERKRPRKK